MTEEKQPEPTQEKSPIEEEIENEKIKLKTLKDVNEEFRKNNVPQILSGDEFNDLWEDRLKLEAVKWKEKLLGEIGFVKKEGETGRMWIIKFIDDFFNLTDEDLK